MPSHDPITGQPFDLSSSSGITDITTDTTLQGKGTSEEPLKVTNPEKDIFLEVDNIEIEPNATYRQSRNGRHAEIDLCHFEQYVNGTNTYTPSIYEQPIDGGLSKRYYFIQKSSTLRLSYPLVNITNKEIDKLIIGVELKKQFEDKHLTMQHIINNFQKRHHYHTHCDTLFLVQKDYKNTTRLYNLLSVNSDNLADNLTEKRYYKNYESDTNFHEINNGDTERGLYGYIMGTPYSANNFLGSVIGYDAFSATNYIMQERAIFDSIFGIEKYIVQSMYIKGTGLSQTLEIELILITASHSQPYEITKYVSGGIHIYLP